MNISNQNPTEPILSLEDINKKYLKKKGYSDAYENFDPNENYQLETRASQIYYTGQLNVPNYILTYSPLEKFPISYDQFYSVLNKWVENLIVVYKVCEK